MPTPYLPPEILEQIFSYTPLGYHGQAEHHNYSLVSRSWYGSSIQRLYASPSITGKNFDAFVRTLCPSVNANVRRTDLALFVLRLDMSRLVYSGSKSLTARVLGRVKGQLRHLVAPAATFSLLAFSALAKCYGLQTLDLEWVIEKIDAVLLLRTVAKLRELERLSLRMAWVNPKGVPRTEEELYFPASLRRLAINGICEPAAETLLNAAMEQSRIECLAVLIGHATSPYLTTSIPYASLRKLYLDIDHRLDTYSDDSICIFIIGILIQCSELEELSIPLSCLHTMFFTTSTLDLQRDAKGGFMRKPTFPLRRVTIHPSRIELLQPVLEDYQWDQLLSNIISGHLQYLEEIRVVDKKDVAKFEELEKAVPGRLDELDQALFDERLERSGLFLAGREDFS